MKSRPNSRTEPSSRLACAHGGALMQPVADKGNITCLRCGQSLHGDTGQCARLNNPDTPIDQPVDVRPMYQPISIQAEEEKNSTQRGKKFPLKNLAIINIRKMTG